MSKTRKCQHRTALEVFPKVGATATPEDIDKHVGGTGSYYSKHMSVMRRWGFEFDVKKDGRNIVSYTLKKEPANAAEYRDLPKAAPAKAKKVAAPKKVAKTPVKAAKKAEKAPAKAPAKVAKKVTEKSKTAATKAKNLENLKTALAKVKAKKEEEVKTPPKASSFSVDEDFDAVDELTVSDLL